MRYFPDDPQKDKAKPMDIIECNLRTDTIAHYDSSVVDRPEECARVMVVDVPATLNTCLMSCHTYAMFVCN